VHISHEFLVNPCSLRTRVTRQHGYDTAALDVTVGHGLGSDRDDPRPLRSRGHSARRPTTCSSASPGTPSGAATRARAHTDRAARWRRRARDADQTARLADIIGRALSTTQSGRTAGDGSSRTTPTPTRWQWTHSSTASPTPSVVNARQQPSPSPRGLALSTRSERSTRHRREIVAGAVDRRQDRSRRRTDLDHRGPLRLAAPGGDPAAVAGAARTPIANAVPTARMNIAGTIPEAVLVTMV
jgi:hypothetical protein